MRRHARAGDAIGLAHLAGESTDIAGRCARPCWWRSTQPRFSCAAKGNGVTSHTLLRPDRDHDLVHRVRIKRAYGGASADWPADLKHAAICLERRERLGSNGSYGRVIYRRRRSSQWLLQAAGTDQRTVSSEYLR